MKPSDGERKPRHRGEPPGREPAQTAIRRILRRLLDSMEARLDGVRADRDSECLHDFRVALRRTRALFSQFGKVLPTPAIGRFRPEFAWLGALTGPARDLDVHLSSFAARSDRLPEEIRADLTPLRELLVETRRRARHELLAGLDSARYRELMHDWRQWLEHPPTGESWGKSADRPIRELADRRIGRLLRRARRQGAAIAADSPATDLHELRKTGKKLRYLLEFFQELYPPKKIIRGISMIKELQDRLGAFQDLQVQVETLRQTSERLTAASRLPVATLLAAGMFLDRLYTDRTRAHQACIVGFARFARPKNRRLFQRMLAEQAAAKNNRLRAKDAKSGQPSAGAAPMGTGRFSPYPTPVRSSRPGSSGS